MSILEAIHQMALNYETETGSKLKGLILSKHDFDILMDELRNNDNIEKMVEYKFRNDPYCGLTIDGLQIEWNEEAKEPSERDTCPNVKYSNEDTAKKLVEGFASSMDNIFRNALKEIKK